MPSATTKSKLEVTEAIKHTNKVEGAGEADESSFQVKAKKVSEKSKPSMKTKEVRHYFIYPRHQPDIPVSDTS